MKSQKKILVALSGGVDSAIAALILKKQGYKVIGAFMKNFSDTKDPITGECNWIQEKLMAQKIASHLDIPLIIFDFEKEYKKLIINPMLKAYSKGLTPNPDISCNTIIKFPLLWKKAQKYKVDYIATGHYARIKKDKLGYHLLTGKDKTKDQSYFLSELSEENLSHTLFPIGNLTKEQVRKIARQNSLPNWNKKSTRGICFVGKINFKDFLSKKIKPNPGKVISPEGKIIGTHQGIAYYTIGQRAGPRIGIELIPKLTGKKYYIAKKIKPNTLVIAPENHPSLKTKLIKIKNLHLINPKEKIPQKVKVRIRHLGDFLQGKLKNIKNDYIFILKKPIQGIAPGQSLVIYFNQKVIGCGEITETS